MEHMKEDRMNKADERIAYTLESILNNDDSGDLEVLLNWGKTCRLIASALADGREFFDTVGFLDLCGFDTAFGYKWRDGFPPSDI